MNPNRGRLRSLGAMVMIGMMLVLGGTALTALDGPGASATPLPTTTSTTAPVTSSTPLCQSVPQLDRLVVRRTDAFPQNHIRFTFPNEVTVIHAASVRSVAEALCVLPRMPSTPMYCPVDLGIVYHLTFTASGETIPTVSVEATGCQVVRGLGASRWVARSPRFWQTLGKAMGLVKADNATFRGRGPNG